MCILKITLLLQVGDPQEVNGIVSVFCQSQRDPLLIGSTKSNMGHPEPASGLAALAKVCKVFFSKSSALISFSLLGCFFKNLEAESLILNVK